MTDWSLRPTKMDFGRFAREAWFGPLDITGLLLVNDDLAVQGAPIDKTDPGVLGMVGSICQERHKAANWLANGGNYANTDTST